jgi:hypothetical protein
VKVGKLKFFVTFGAIKPINFVDNDEKPFSAGFE